MQKQVVSLHVRELIYCDCGGKASVILLDREHTQNKHKTDFAYTSYCNACFEDARKRNEDIAPR